jgi:ParB family chromosome partitioning protein
MAKKQSDYLADLLADGAANAPQAPVETHSPPSPATTPNRAGMSLLGRESALARVASGEVRQVTQLLIDPTRVRVWEGNARFQAQLNEANCRDLIDSIIAEGGQKVPVIVRRIDDDPAIDYELIAGTRRHFTISWLRANNYPDMRLLAQVADLDDEAAFRLADIENRARKDISDIERAKNYASALETHYGGKQRRMADRLNVSESWLSRMLKVAQLPDAVIQLFADPAELSMRAAYPLAVFCADSDKRRIALNRVHKIEDEQQRRNQTGTALLGAAEIIRQLLRGVDTAASPSPALFEVLGPQGRPMLTLAGQNRQGLTVKLHRGAGAKRAELVAAFDQMLAQIEAEGKDLL